jgi:hypothetical protein
MLVFRKSFEFFSTKPTSKGEGADLTLSIVYKYTEISSNK